MRLVYITCLSLFLAGCHQNDPYITNSGDITSVDGNICIYTKDASASDKYTAYEISQYPEWQYANNWIDVHPFAASQTCLPFYPYKKGETYNVVFKINNGKDGIRNYRVLFRVNSDGAVQQLK
ncbi:hypothetical protein MUA04_22375 [Enterobacteriaceae bacterium H11S18]|uniref:putative T6SS immunity periplasmic lipoprotein n=1 Tax=Dryocola clanedunensis TaxID=2925396 RepID=UPI0022EFF39C|nr:putative T6SS immunity periplasmic lipoprotein [Dryocola clanedunensis]MCT4712918.1 hypothetical protein [Dryocola clanedunensis]